MTRGRRPLAVDLFSGAGGLSLGFEQAGFDVAAAVEYDPVHAAVHEYNFPHSVTVCADVCRISGDQIRERAGIEREEIDVVVGGPPCQGISMIGKRNITDERNDLLLEFARLVRELEPKYFVMENVAGLIVGSHRALLDRVVDALKSSGYVIDGWRILQAAEYGVPQSRKRLFLLGHRPGEVPLSYPSATCTPRNLNGSSGRGLLPMGPSVFEAIGEMVNADDYEELLVGDSVAIGLKNQETSQYAMILNGSCGDSEDFSHPRSYDKGILTSSSRTRHTERSIERFRATRPGETEPISRFFRLHPDGISNTLRAGTGSERGAYTAPRPIHPFFPRVITVREAARLHGYPDWFRFHVTKWNGFREVGNSVPVPLARAVAGRVIDALGVNVSLGEPYEMGDAGLLSLSQNEAMRYFRIEDRPVPRRRKL